jgi:hypothetical protein
MEKFLIFVFYLFKSYELDPLPMIPLLLRVNSLHQRLLMSARRIRSCQVKILDGFSIFARGMKS